MFLQSELAAVLLSMAIHGCKASARLRKYKLLERYLSRALASKACNEFDKTLRIHQHCHGESDSQMLSTHQVYIVAESIPISDPESDHCSANASVQ